MTAPLRRQRGARRAREGPGREATRTALGDSSIAASLGTVFNFLVLNLAVVVSSVLVVTLPLAVGAAVATFEAWHAKGEGRFLRVYGSVLLSRASARSAVVVGVPLVACAVGLEEVHYFLGRPALGDQVCLGLGSACLLVALTALPYAMVLSGRLRTLGAADVWTLSVRCGIRNLLRTGPLFLAEIAAAALLAHADPSLLLLGLPAIAIFSLYKTALSGLRKLHLEAAPAS